MSLLPRLAGLAVVALAGCGGGGEPTTTTSAPPGDEALIEDGTPRRAISTFLVAYRFGRVATACAVVQPSFTHPRDRTLRGRAGCTRGPDEDRDPFALGVRIRTVDVDCDDARAVVLALHQHDTLDLQRTRDGWRIATVKRGAVCSDVVQTQCRRGR
jgi:hypothetical protein